MDKAELLCKVDELTACFGSAFVLENLCKSLSSDVLEDHLKYLYRCFEIPFEQEEEDEEETEDEEL